MVALATVAEMIRLIMGDERRIGPERAIYAAFQCGCGWSVIAEDLSGLESHTRLRDEALLMLIGHIAQSRNPFCTINPI